MGAAVREARRARHRPAAVRDRRDERAHQSRPHARARGDRDTPQHRDYVVVDGILERVQDEIKERFTTGVIKDIDKAGGRVDDMLASWSVSHARDNAWMQAQTLDALSGSGFLHKQFLLALGRNVGFAGRALLIRTG
jgi:hypothetical protein